jgi:hypothetical protein
MTRRQQPATGAPKALWNAILAHVGAITNRDATPEAVALWSFLHGYATLERNGAFGASGPKGALEIGLEALIHSFERT